MPSEDEISGPWDRLCSRSEWAVYGTSSHTVWEPLAPLPPLVLSPLPFPGSEVEQGPALFPGSGVRGQVRSFIPLCWMSNCRCCQKLRKGAMPVPGPTRMQGTWGFRGRWKLGALDKKKQKFLMLFPTPTMEPRVDQAAILETHGPSFRVRIHRLEGFKM